MKTLLFHPSGHNFARALLGALQREGMLGLFVTSMVFRESDRFMRLLPGALRAELLRRKFDVPAGQLWTRPWRELGRLLASRCGLGFLTRGESAPFSWESVYEGVDRFVARRLERARGEFGLDWVYGYEDAAFHTFKEAVRIGLRRAYDLPIAYWETSRRLISEERERLPEWAGTMPGARDSQAKLDRKTAELEMADIVVCPSQFVHDSLPPWCRERKRCVIAEFGSPAPVSEPDEVQRKKEGPLRVLFAGSMSQRKGLADLFSAMKRVNRKDVELVVFGSPIAPMEFYRRQHSGFIHEGPRPNHEVLRLMKSCDVLVLPSIVEGRALVQQEALMCGLPLIITPNTGGSDLIEEGKTGFLVPIRSPELLAEKIEWFADHRPQIEEMRPHARAMAARLTWEGYAAKITRELRA